MTIGIVDIGMGNFISLKYALHSQGWDAVPVRGINDFKGLSHLLLPGVGSFASAMARLHNANLIEPILEFAAKGSPLMGICVGMQILASIGVEGGQTRGLGLIPGRVVPIGAKSNFRLPHVGWNESIQKCVHPLMMGIRKDVDFYFVHSYQFLPDERCDVLAETCYGESFPSIIGKGSVVGTQFHPEKSQTNGMRLLDNFCQWNGKC